MFNEKKRPFFKLARNEELAPLPEAEIITFLRERFKQAGKRIPTALCRRIARLSRGHAYYMQYLAQELFYLSGEEATQENLERALASVLDKERYGFTAVVQGLPLQQLRLLKALAMSPEAKPTGAGFIARAGMAGSTILDALHKLIEQDIVEKDQAGLYRVVDPLFDRWLAGEG